MLPETITSLQHRLVKHAYQLKRDKHYRQEKKELLLIGRSPLEEVTKHLPAKMLFTPVAVETGIQAQESYRVDERVVEKITGSSQPIPFAIFDFPKSADLTHKPYILVLDQLQDPGNLGTLFRSAYALGFNGVYLLTDTVDPFNDKALSASKGACLLLPFAYLSEEELKERVFREQRSCFLADIKGESLLTLTYQTPLFLILSHEARGARDWSFSLTKITIPMREGVDSLNVASAGAILLHQIYQTHHGKG